MFLMIGLNSETNSWICFPLFYISLQQPEIKYFDQNRLKNTNKQMIFNFSHQMEFLIFSQVYPSVTVFNHSWGQTVDIFGC